MQAFYKSVVFPTCRASVTKITLKDLENSKTVLFSVLFLRILHPFFFDKHNDNKNGAKMQLTAFLRHL
ncbi:MAG: hypothetical protein LBV16_06640 [Elusimicrobiota bacterium]|nr:hypothetical protein [Elusimicrobiota bacterium]